MDERDVARGDDTAIVLNDKKGRTSTRLKVEVALSLIAIAVTALVFAFVSPTKITNASRISHLESLVKCPTCISVSTADANTASAIALRSYISTMVNSGASDQEVIAQLEATYGRSVLLVPPNGYGAFLVTGTLALAIVAPLGFIVVRVRRRRRNESRLEDSVVADLVDQEALDGPDSIDISVAASSYEQGEDGDLVVDDGTGQVGGGDVKYLTKASRFSTTQRIVGVLGLLFLLSGVGILGFGIFSTSRGTSSNQLSPTEISTLISNGQTLASFGQDKSALSAFSRVLTSNPNQPVALAWNGWLLTKSGVSAKSSSLVSAGIAQLKQSIAVDATYLYSRLFYGLVLANDLQDSTGAVAQFTKFFALNPPRNLVTTIKSELVAVYGSAKVTLPTQLR